jgi:hypothetical protein
MAKVGGTAGALQASPVRGASQPDPSPAVHPPQRPGRAGPVRQEARVAGGRSSFSSSPPDSSPPGIPPPGLVRYAITGRVSRAEPVDSPFAGFFQGRFAGQQRVDQAAAAFGRDVLAGSDDVPSWGLIVAPGVVRMVGRDLEQSYWADARAIRSRRSLRRPVHRGEVTSWTRKSRARMARQLASLDWSYLADAPGLPAMLTLTYPADWLPVAGSGADVKRHLRMLQKRWQRAWGEPLRGAWKLEFQARGAPHVHIGPVAVPLGAAGAAGCAVYEAELAAWQAGRRSGQARERVRQLRQAAAAVHPDRGGSQEAFIEAHARYLKARRRRDPKPRYRSAVADGLPFNRWLSQTWADIVAHPDPAERERHILAGTNVAYREGMRCADPHRLSVYFSKHGAARSKDYQNRVPAEWREQGKGPGRFWGYWDLRPATAMVELHKREHLLISRTLRHMSERSHVWNPQTRRLEVVPATREVTVTRHRRDAAGAFRRNQVTGGLLKPRKRKVRRRVRRLKYHRGFVCVNDGPELAVDLARLTRPSDPARLRVKPVLRGPIGPLP